MKWRKLVFCNKELNSKYSFREKHYHIIICYLNLIFTAEKPFQKRNSNKWCGYPGQSGTGSNYKVGVLLRASELGPLPPNAV